MGVGTLYAIRRITSILFVCIILFAFIVRKEHPILVTIGAMILLSAGGLLFTYGLASAERYKKVYDYEPVIFMGKPSNGKTARETLMIFSTTGLWALLTGGALLLI